METMEIYNNTSNGKNFAEKYRYPTMNVDNIKAIGTDSYSIPDRDMPPILDPYSASKRSKSQIPSLSERIKNTVKTNYYDDISICPHWDIWHLIKVIKVGLTLQVLRYR